MAPQVKKVQSKAGLSFNQVQNVFFLNGISASLDWNSLLSSLDYFHIIYKGYNVYLFFPIPQFVGYVASSALFNKMINKFGYENLIKVGILGTNLSLWILLAISQFCQQSIVLGFYLSLLTTFILGFTNNLCQLSFFALINYFGSPTVSKFTIGTSVSGLVLISIRALVTAILGEQKPTLTQIFVYYLIGNMFNLFNLFCNIKLFKSKIFQQRQITHLQIRQQDLEEKQNNEQNEQKPYFQRLYRAFKITNPHCLIILVDIMITFSLFPNLVSTDSTSANAVWIGLAFIFIFNIGDFFGRLAADKRSIFNSKSIFCLLLTRLVFYYTIPLFSENIEVQNYLFHPQFYPFLNLFIFAFTNGFILNGSFILSYQKSPAKLRNDAGIICGILWQVGVMLGTFLAIPIHSIVKIRQ